MPGYGGVYDMHGGVYDMHGCRVVTGVRNNAGLTDITITPPTPNRVRNNAGFMVVFERLTTEF